MVFSVMGSQDQRSIETVHDAEFTDTRRETVEKENRILEKQHPKKWIVWYGHTDESKPSKGQSKEGQDKCNKEA